jgi:hypothetical protein
MQLFGFVLGGGERLLRTRLADDLNGAGRISRPEGASSTGEKREASDGATVKWS